MIITVEEVNSILQISGKDGAIQSIIPFAESHALDYCKNYFHIPDQCISGYGISFEAATKKISNSQQNFISELAVSFQPGLHIHVQNSILNDGIFLIASVNQNELIVSSDDTLFDEDDGTFIALNLAKIPKGFKISLAKYIGYLLKGSSSDLQSESIGDYSYTLKPSDEILSQYFIGYRKIGVV